MAALKDIAKIAGVSVGTVSQILNQGRAHLYSAQTRQRVVEISRNFGYRPNRSAQAMRSQKTKVVGFAALNRDEEGQLQNYNVYPFVVGLSSQLARDGYHVAFVECADLGDRDEPTRPWSVQENFLDGLVVHYGLSDRAARFVHDIGVPAIWWDSGVFEPTGCVYRDEVEVGREVTRRLIELGHRRIGFTVGQHSWQEYCAGRPLHYSYAQRFETYRDELRTRGLHEVPIIGYDPQDLARQLAEHRLTAMIIQGTNTSHLQAPLALLGWRIPQDLSIATLDREAQMPVTGPRIGGMLYDRCAVGEQAARMVLSMLKDDQTDVPSVRYVGKFDIGDTISPPRAVEE